MDKIRSVGHPLLFETPETLIELIDEYIKDTPEDTLTLTGLCLAMGTNKQTLSNYEKKDDYKEIVQRAKLYIEHAYELSLRKHGRSGDIFALKNFNWKDKQEMDLNAQVIIKFDDLEKDL